VPAGLLVWKLYAPSGAGLVLVVTLSVFALPLLLKASPFGLGITLLTVYTGTRRG
jgi:hypothetical protein